MIVCKQISNPYPNIYMFIEILALLFQNHEATIINISQHRMKKINEKQIIRVQQLKYILTIGASCKKWQRQMRNSKQRYNILKEWSATQSSYIEDLKIIEDKIQQPLKQAKLISDQQDRLLFPNIKAMINLSQNMNACIDATIKSWNPNETMIGENLMVFYKFFMIYREYCNNFMKAQQIVKCLKKNPQAVKIEEKLKLDFQSYTIKPVQRPPKYQLLLREYHKCLSKNHKDYSIIQSAIEKYHQVNELNNQSMDRQIRAQLMIKLDKKYGNIISSRTGRQYLKEFTCKCVNFKCIIYAFNDMLLLVQKRSEQYEQIYKRLYLDGSSYIIYKKHFKYYDNMIFVCGVNKSAHLEFDTFADAEYFREAIQRIIQILYKREEQRRIRYNQNEVRRKNLAKFRVTKWFDQVQSKIVYKPKLEIKVQSTLRSKAEAFYAVQFKIIYPYNASQTILLTFDQIIAIQQLLRSKYKDFEYTKLGYIPQHIGIIQAAKNRSKIIEYRSFIIEQFLNLIFRNEQYYNSWKMIAQQIGVNLDLFQFVTTENFSCTCNLCIQMKQNHHVAYYRMLLKRPKNQLNRLAGKSSINAEEAVLGNIRSQIFQINNNRKSNNSCPFYIFNIFYNIKKAQKSQLTHFPDKMLALQAEMGQINYSLLTPNIVPLRANINIKIYLLNIEQQYIQIKLKEDKYVRQILEEIATNNSLQTIYDWSLYIYFEGKYTKIGNDQKLLDFVSKWGIQIQKSQEEIGRDSFFRAKIDNIKKWGQQFWGSKKGKIFLKKSLHFEHQIQIQACKANKQRYHFLINEVFGRIKFQNLYLSYDQIVSMCAFFLLKNQFEKVKHWTEQNIDLAPLKQLIPAFYFPYLKNDKFKKQLVVNIKKHYGQLQQFQNSRNAIELIYLKILSFLRNSQEWITMYFTLSTYNGDLMNDVMIGVNYSFFTVFQVKDRKPLLVIELQKLKYKTSTFSIFIYEGGSKYRYDGPQTDTIRQLIETYLCYFRLFNSQQ